MTEDRLIPAVTAIIDYYKANAKGKEKFSKFVERTPLEQLLQVAAGEPGALPKGGEHR
ncbi:hypothetical protein LJK87_41335 [Paenibacillus sp. P25]|nr:hypothetical protein LJK87_41335 [Paenibacillus sp. P25]